jgi:Transglutaminase-like superfamily
MSTGSGTQSEGASATAVVDHAEHTPFSDPGEYASLLTAVPIEPTDLSAVARNVIVHYRASGHELPEVTREEVNARWVNRILAADQGRHPWPLDQPREVTSRVQGCCRDHTLFCVAAFRAHGVPARSRVGYAGYFVDGWHHDHVIVEAWLGGRWRLFDSEVDEPRPSLTTPTDMSLASPGEPGFVTAAQAWTAYRRGDIDPETYGVDPNVPVFRGPRFVFDEVIYEVAHRFGDELLLWDAWGRIGEPGSPVSAEDAWWLDDVAALLLDADAGDLDAERQLLDRYRSDDGLHPGTTILQASPFGADPVPVALSRTSD